MGSDNRNKGGPRVSSGENGRKEPFCSDILYTVCIYSSLPHREKVTVLEVDVAAVTSDHTSNITPLEIRNIK